MPWIMTCGYACLIRYPRHINEFLSCFRYHKEQKSRRRIRSIMGGCSACPEKVPKCVSTQYPENMQLQGHAQHEKNLSEYS